MMQSRIDMRQYNGTHPDLRSTALAVPAARVQVAPAAAGMAVVEAALGHEWLVSGLNKVLSPDFGPGLAKNLQQSLHGNPNGWYVSLVHSVVLPHATLFAFLVETGEVLVALGLFAGAVLWVSGRLRASALRLLNPGVIAALVGAILMSANYALMSGDTVPGLNPSNPFNEGISIDSLFVIIGLGLLIVHLLTSRRRTPAAAGG
jgi:thiosulfate dehydrogenase [quinone] large subunit